jgi:peroxiredoxin
VIAAGERLPDVPVWLRPNEPVRTHELAGPKGVLLVFYLFDWSST